MPNKMETFRPAYRQEHVRSRVFFIFCLLTIVLLLLTAVDKVANAATYYLDAENGDDSNSGTSEQPWRTLAKAQSVLVEKDIVLLRSGNYGAFINTVTVRSNWITYKADDGHAPILTSINLGRSDGPFNKYLRFEGITIQTNEPNATAVSALRAPYLKFINCNIIGSGYKHGTDSNDCYGIYCKDLNNVEISGCAFSGAGAGYYPGFDYAIFLRNVDNVDINSCDIKESDTGIEAYYCSGWIIHNCHVHDCLDNGVWLNGISNITVEDNHIHHIIRPPGSATHNDCLQISTAYTTFNPENIVIRRNNMHHSAGQIVMINFIGNAYASNVTFENNLIYGGDVANEGAWEIHAYDVNGLTFVNNTGTGKFLFRSGVKFDHMTNNILETVDFEGAVVNDENYNIIKKWWIHVPPDYNQGDHTVELENDELFANLFVDYTNNDLQLKSGSRAIDFGSAVHAPISDILGVSRVFPPDAGCYEYGSADSNNQAPVLESVGNKTVNENVLLTFTVSATDADEDTLTYSATSLPSGATFAGQTFSWTPDYNQAETYQVTFIASDGQAQDSETITLTVNNVNRPPVLDAIGSKSVDENSSLNFSVSATDADGDMLTYSAPNLPSGATFAGQTFSWTPSYNQAETYQVTFIANDGQAQDSETVTITVGNTNRAPVLTSIGNKSVNENSALSFSVSAADADSDTITYSVESLPSGAAFASRTLTWTPSYGQAGTHQVKFVASDSQAQDSETITVTVNNVNRAPVLSTIGNKSIYTDDSLSFTVSATDPDGDTITYSVEGLPSGATFANRIFSWTPADSQVGSYAVTFTASDGQAQDSETVTITVSNDASAPSVTNCSPAANTIQVPLNNLIILHIVDTGTGVDANSVTIKVNNSIVYTGNSADYSSAYGHCRRVGTNADYTFVYQANQSFDFDQTVTVTVNATDLAGNAMNEYSYSFKTEMCSFGTNKKVNSSSDNSSEGMPSTVRDSNGDIWAAWHAGQTGSRDIYIGKLTAGADNFGSSVQLTSNNTDQCNAAIAVDNNNKLYIVWQDNRQGNWDIYISTSVNGTNWSIERPVIDSNGNQTNPAIVIDGSSSKNAYVVWQDDQAGNQDIYVASSSNDFVTKTVSRITSDSSDQTEPAIAVNSGNTIYVVWTDARGGSNNIYGAASNSGPWTNVAIVSNANNQSSPAIAAEAAGSILHFVWVDNTSGNSDIYYASSNGLPGSPLTGSTIIDDTSRADQLQPAIAVTGSTGNNLKVFACWQDERNADTDLYFVEVSSGSETNVLVGDDGTNANQSEPAIGVDIYNHPYIVWADNRNTNTDIYYAGSTFIESNALASKNVSASLDATVGTAPASINSVDDVSVIVPAGAYACDIEITISRVQNPSEFTIERLSLPYEFGPSGITFNQPVTITIPYEVSASGNSASAYWYNPLTGSLSQQGITNIENIVISSTLNALRFKTTHLTQFLVGGISSDTSGAGGEELDGGDDSGGGGGGGGGCAMSPNGQGSIVEFLLPYVGLIIVMIVIKCRDTRKLKTRNTARSKC